MKPVIARLFSGRLAWMKRMRVSIFMKLVLTFLAVLLPLYTVTLLLNRAGSRDIRHEITKSAVNNNRFYMQSFDSEVNRINQLLLNFVIDKDLQELGNSVDDIASYDRTAKLIAVQKRLQLLKASSHFIEEVKVFFPKLDRTLTSTDFDTRVSSAEYKPLANNLEANRLVAIDERLFMSFRYPTSIYTNRPPVFVIAVELSTSVLRSSLFNIVDPEQGYSVLYHARDGWIVASDPDKPVQRSLQAFANREAPLADEAGAVTVAVGQTNYLVSYKTSALSDATLLTFMPQDDILRSLRFYEKWAWILLAMAILIVVSFAYSLLRIIHQPLRRLVFAFRKVEEGNLTPIVTTERGDEFRYLYHRFNSMVARLDVLIHQVYEKEIRNQRLTLKQLQSQMNPHFLYNCFFILKRLIQTADNEKAFRFAMYLGDYFRFITRSASDKIPLETEMRHVRNYVDIQTICYGDRIAVAIEPPNERCRVLPVPRMMILPVVENAYKYAFHQASGQGELWIHDAVKDGYYSLMIEDNGSVLHDDDIAAMAARLADSDADGLETTGLINVHRRIEIMFGTGSGVRLSRSQLGGLCAAIRLKLDPDGL